jgi:2-dehydro-3-deoxygalactonokinase
MRGEETQLLGAVAATEPSVIVVLPGTHSKLAIVDRGTVVDFSTYMTGELYAVLLDHSILGRMARHVTDLPLGAAFARGVQHGLHAGGLSHDVFGARTLALAGELSADHVADWMSGLLIGREIHDATAWSRAAGVDATVVRIVGSDALAERYGAALMIAGIAAERGAADAAARGLWRVAGQAGLLH